MNEILIFALGVGVGAIATYFGIMLFAKNMEKNKKEFLVKVGQDKWKTK